MGLCLRRAHDEDSISQLVIGGKHERVRKLTLRTTSRIRKVTTVVGLLVPFLLVCAPLFAQPPGETGYDQYRRLRMQARLYVNLQRPVRAAEALIQSYEHYPDEGVLLAAVSQYEAGEEDERALRLAERYLTVTRSPEGRDEARQKIHQIRDRLGQHSAEIQFNTDPAGARVCLSEEAVQCFDTPILKWVKAGEYTLRFHYPGLASRVHPIEFKSGRHLELNVSIRPQVAIGRLDVFAVNPDAQVTLNGHHVGQVPILEHSIATGIHTLSVDNGNGSVWRGEIEIHPGRTTTIYAGKTAPKTPIEQPPIPQPVTSLDPPPPVQVTIRTIVLPRIRRVQVPTHDLVETHAPPKPEQAETTADLTPAVAVELPPVAEGDVATTEQPTVARTEPTQPEEPPPATGMGPEVAQAPVIPDLTPPAPLSNLPEPSLPDSNDSQEKPVETTHEPPPSENNTDATPPLTRVPVPVPLPDLPGPAPIESNPLPDSPEPRPETTDPLPMDTEPFPVTTEPLPMDTEPFPVTTEPLPMGDDSFPETTEPLPMGDDSFPETTEPLPMGDSSFPETTEPLPMGDDSFPSDLGSADSDPGFQYDSAPMNEPSSNVSISSGPGPSWQVITGWTTIGLGVAALSGAIATSYLALSGIDEADQLDPFAPNYLTSFESVQSDIENQALISNILYPLGGALLTTGIVLLVLDATDGPSAISTVDDNFRMDALPLRGGVLLRTSLDF